MKRVSVLVIVLLFLVATGSIRAQENSRVGTTGAQFMKVGVGARAAALGECGTATAGITGLYWNPAAIAAERQVSAFFSYSSMYAGLSHNFFGLTYPLGAGQTVGVGVIYMTSDDIEMTTLENPEGLGTYYSLNDYAINVSYSRYVTDRLALGISGKYVHEGFYRMKATAFAVDLGSILDTGLLGIKLAMNLSNFGGSLKMVGADLRVDYDRWPETVGAPSKDADLLATSWPLPMIFRIGLQTDLVGVGGQLMSSEANRVTVFADGVDTNDALPRSSVGVEYVWNEILALRGGYRGLVLAQDEFDTYSTASYCFGAGLHYNIGGIDLTFDYAYTDFQILGNTQQASLILKL